MEAGFWKSLFDFRFEQFVVPKVIKFLYWIGMIVAAIIFVVMFVMGIIGMGGYNPIGGVVTFLLSPVVGFLVLLYCRIILELTMVAFRLMHLLEGIAQAKGVEVGHAGPAAPPPPPTS